MVSLENLHYPFCSDLGNKTIKEIVWPENINFALFKIKQTIDGGGGRDIPNTEIFIPGFYEVKKVNQDFWSVLTEKEYQTFIAPADYYEDRDFFYTKKNNHLFQFQKKFGIFILICLIIRLFSFIFFVIRYLQLI